jgi:hypothetical protein
MMGMSSTTALGPGGAPDDREKASWTSENLSVAVRRELLQRELRKLGFRKAGADGASPRASGSGQQQPQPRGGSHAQADDDSGSHSE